MKPWGSLFAKLVAQQLTSNPRLREAEAIQRTRDRLLEWGLGMEKIEEFEQEYKNLGASFQHKGVLNPLYLEQQLGKRLFLHPIDARNGRYRPLRKFMEAWTRQQSPLCSGDVQCNPSGGESW